MEIPPLLRPSFWFNPSPVPFQPIVERGLLVIFGAFLFIGILSRIVAMRAGLEKMVKRLIIKISVSLMILGVLGLMLYGFYFERITVLGSRFWYLIWLALFGWYAWKIWKYAFVEIPEIEKKRAEREAAEKWLPKPKT